MKTAYILVGISASGKSTRVLELGADRDINIYEVNRDEIRKNILTKKGFSVTTENIWKHWNFKWEDEVTEIWTERKVGLVKEGRNIVFSDTNLDKRKVVDLKIDLEMYGYEVIIEVLETPVDVCIKRDIKRKDTVGQDVIWKQYEKFKENGWSSRKRYTPKHGTTKAIIVDIDGTLAHMNGHRGPFEWDKVHLDDVDIHIRTIVNMYGASDDHHVIVMSGRDGVCYSSTEKWLQNNHVLYDWLFMREEGDTRKDSIIKEELFWNYVADKFDVQFVIDDRPQVVRMWMDLGLKVHIVGNPYIEF